MKKEIIALILLVFFNLLTLIQLITNSFSFDWFHVIFNLVIGPILLIGQTIVVFRKYIKKKRT